MEKNIKKRMRQSGREYKDDKGQLHRERKIQLSSSCDFSCCHDCIVKFSEFERKQIFNSFWGLSDNEKTQFYSKFIKRCAPKRKRTQKTDSRKQFTYKYYFETNSVTLDVCQKFFLSTLDISKQRIYYFFKNYYNETGTPTQPKHGKHIKKVTPDADIEDIKNHIKSFPVVDSHYCRANSQKQYLEAGLTLSKMYKMYVEKTRKPVKSHIYMKVFNESFNLSFFKPKKDVCDKCVKYKITEHPLEKEKQEYNLHRSNHKEAKNERDMDRKNTNSDTAIILYDLQNVFSLPKANISNFFYKRKYAVYNLTGFCQNNKVTYCSIWHEALNGRSGNDIPSALNNILKNVVHDLPNIKNIVLWSDACIPQNKNRMVSLALLKFLEAHRNIDSIIHKYSEPGHSQVQELDAVHSAIEKYIRDLEVHSPVSLIRILKGMNYDRVKLKITQLKKDDFLNFNKASINLKMISYQQCRQIKYQQDNLLSIFFKRKHSDKSFDSSKIAKGARNLILNERLPTVEKSKLSIKLTKEKKKDIQSMIPFMCNVQDQKFYENIIKNH